MLPCWHSCANWCAPRLDCITCGSMAISCQLLFLPILVGPGGLGTGAFCGLLFCGVIFLIVPCIASYLVKNPNLMDPETAPPGAAHTLAAVAPQLGAPPTLTFEERLAGMDVAACRAEMEKDLEAGQTELISQRIEHLEVK